MQLDPEIPRWYEVPNDFVREIVPARALLTVWSCATSPYERGGHPAGFSRYNVERDYRECEYKAGLANQQHLHSSGSPFPFGSGPETPADHARALHGLSTVNAMWDTCLAAKGYRVE